MLNITKLPYPKIGGGNVKTFILPEDLALDQWIIPAGAEVKLMQTKNFGWVCLKENQKDKRDFIIPQRMFKY